MNKWNQYQFGKIYEVGRNSQTSALEDLNKRFEHLLPVELIEADQMRKMIRGVNVKCDRGLDPQEVESMLESFKSFLIRSIDSMDKWEGKRHERSETQYEGRSADNSESVL